MTKPLKISIILFLFLSNISIMKSQNISDNEISGIIDKAREKFSLPAIAISVMSAENIYILQIKGNSTHGKSKEVKMGDYFHIGSCSKSVLAIIAGRLVEDGKIDWKTKFFEVYPELKESTNSDYHHITLEDLFLCKAGIQAYISDEEAFPEINKESNHPRLEFGKYLLSQKPTSERLKDNTFNFVYSNASYTMVSILLEKVSSKSYEELIEYYIVNELGLTTYIGFPNKYQSDQPWGHWISKKGIEIFPPDHEYVVPYLIQPAGDLSMPPQKFAEYVQLHLAGLRGKDNFITAKTWNYLHFGFQGFSIGVGNAKMSGLSISGLDGSAGTFYCRAILVPKSDFAFTIMTNAGTSEAEMKAINWITKKILKRQYKWWWKFWM